MLKKRGMQEMTESWFLENFCFPVKDYYLKLGFDFEIESFDISGTEFINLYMARCHELQLHQGVREVLDYFKNLGLAQSLVSASSQLMLDQILSTPVTRCDEVPWDFLYLSMANWNTVISLIFLSFWLRILNKILFKKGINF